MSCLTTISLPANLFKATIISPMFASILLRCSSDLSSFFPPKKPKPKPTAAKPTPIPETAAKIGKEPIPASDNVIRLLPPLIINKEEVDTAINIIEKTLK